MSNDISNVIIRNEVVSDFSGNKKVGWTKEKDIRRRIDKIYLDLENIGAGSEPSDSSGFSGKTGPDNYTDTHDSPGHYEMKYKDLNSGKRQVIIN